MTCNILFPLPVNLAANDCSKILQKTSSSSSEGKNHLASYQWWGAFQCVRVLVCIIETTGWNVMMIIDGSYIASKQLVWFVFVQVKIPRQKETKIVSHFDSAREFFPIKCEHKLFCSWTESRFTYFWIFAFIDENLLSFKKCEVVKIGSRLLNFYGPRLYDIFLLQLKLLKYFMGLWKIKHQTVIIKLHFHCHTSKFYIMQSAEWQFRQ